MISFWVTRAASFGIETYRRNRGRAIGDRFVTRLYDDVSRRLQVDRGPQIFAAIDQLTATQKEVAALIWDAHAHVAPSAARLNDPRRVLLRFELLLRLHDVGVNRFRVWRAADLEQVDRFPVFLRVRCDHSGPRTGLLRTHGDVARAIRALRVRGRSLANLIVVEFCDTSGPDGLFRKYSAFKVGDRIVPCHLMVARAWSVKSQRNVMDEAAIRDEIRFMETNPHEHWLRRAFEFAGIDYGRVDYGVVAGMPQVWEINLNPTLGRDATRHSSLTPDLKALRSRGREAYHERLRAAFSQLDASDDAGEETVEIDGTLLARLAREARRRQRRQWVSTRLLDLYAHPTLGRPARMVYRTLFRRQ